MSEILPITYVIDFTQKTKMESAIDRFAQVFNLIEKNKTQTVDSIN